MNRLLLLYSLLITLSFVGCATNVPSVASNAVSSQKSEPANVSAAALPRQDALPEPVSAAPPPAPQAKASDDGFGDLVGIGKGGGGSGSGIGIGYGGGSGRGSVAPKRATISYQGDESQQAMPNFNWPPPKASAREVIPDTFLRRSVNGEVLFRDVDHILRSALDNCGYSESSYYAVPGGFAIATRIEQINKNGVPKPGESRWALKTSPINPFSDFSAYMSALFKGNPGYYRVIVFIITSNGFSQDTKGVSKDEVEGWFNTGFNLLPAKVGSVLYSPDHHCTALIYEFKKTPKSSTPVIPGTLTGKIHLMRSGIWSYLKPQP